MATLATRTPNVQAGDTPTEVLASMSVVATELATRLDWIIKLNTILSIVVIHGRRRVTRMIEDWCARFKQRKSERQFVKQLTK